MDLVVDLNFRIDTSALYSDVVLPSATWYQCGAAAKQGNDADRNQDGPQHDQSSASSTTAVP